MSFEEQEPAGDDAPGTASGPAVRRRVPSLPPRITQSRAGRIWQTFWRARKSPSLLIRVLWLLVWGLAAVLVVSGPNRLAVLAIFWFCLNLGIVVVCGVWGLFHPRPVFRATPSILGLALLMTLLSTSGMLALQDALGAPRMGGVLFSGSALMLMALAAFPFVLLLCLFLSALGACIGAFCTRHEPDYPMRGRWAVAGWWAAYWLTGTLLAQEILPALTLNIAVGAPFFACLSELLALRVYRRNILPLRLIASFLDRRCRMRYRLLPADGAPSSASGRWDWLRRERWLDLRGAALGLVAGSFVLVSGLLGIFSPVQARLLGALVEFRSAPLLAQLPTVGFDRLLESSDRRWRASDMVLVRMDGATRRRILQSGSETAVQAEVLRRLRRAECRLIALPTPLLDVEWQSHFQPTIETPRVDEAAVERGQRDLPQLIQAARQAGNTFLMMRILNKPEMPFFEELLADLTGTPPPKRTAQSATRAFPFVQKLAQAARGVGTTDLDTLDSPRLPAMQLAWQRRFPQQGSVNEVPPLPFVLSAALYGQPLPERLDQPRAVRFRLGRETLPTTNPGKILVSYFAGQPNTAFLTLDYQTLLGGETLLPRTSARTQVTLSSGSAGLEADRETAEAGGPAGEESPKTEWTPLDALLKGKIVFLEGVDPRLRPTPIGELSEPELMAHATLTLLTRSIAHRFWLEPFVQVIVTTLLLSILIGHLTFFRHPLQAGWQALLILFLFVIVSMLSFLFALIWIDMLIPALAGFLSYLLVVQYSYATSKMEVSRNRELLERFLDQETVDRLLERGEDLALGGVRKPIVVLFADVRGFSRFASEHPPEVVVTTINRYLTAMAEQVLKHRGYLDKFLGDGMLALFGIPTAEPDDAERAVRCAIAMQAEAARISAELIQEGEEPLYLGIGLHYGEAIFGLMGSVRRPDLTAIGHTVVVSQRIQSTAEAGEIVLSDTLYRQLSTRVEAQERPPVQVKGLLEPVHSYRLIALRGQIPGGS